MILGIQLYGPLAKGTVETRELLRGLRKTEIDRAEPCISLDGKNTDPSFWNMEQCRELFPFMREIGLEVISCHVSCNDYLESIPAMTELAKNYGIKHFVVGVPEAKEEVLQERAFVYRQIADAILPYGARLLIHNGKADIAAKINGVTAYEYLTDICLGKAGMQFDTGWAARGGENPMSIIRRNAGRIESLHFKDFDMSKDTDADVCIGQGTLDNEMFMQFGRAKGIPLFIDSDVYNDIFEDAEKSYRYLMDIGQQRPNTISYLNVYDTETGKIEVLKRFKGIIEAPNWINGGNCLLYNSEGSVYTFDLKTKESRKIDTGIADRCNNDHVVSADEKMLAVSSDYDTGEGSGSRIFILPLGGGEARLVTKNAPSYLHGWSPDGKELAYCAFRNVNGKHSVGIYTISAEGGEEKCIASEGFNDGPEYSPDGKHIWFISTKTGLMQLYRMDRDGSNAVQMTFEDRNNWFGHVSPDCSRVVNLAYRAGDSHPGEHLPNMQVELWLMNYDGSERKRILEFFGGQGSINVNSWSGDSRYFAFVSYDVEW